VRNECEENVVVVFMEEKTNEIKKKHK